MVDQRRPNESEEEASTTGKALSRRDFLKVAGIAGATVGLGAGLGGVIAACGGTEETTTTSTPTTAAPTSSSVTTATTAPASTTTVSAGPEAGRELRVGMVAPQTGAFAAFAVADDWQVKHTEDALKDGLVCGDGKLHTVKIIVKDSQSDSNRAAQVGGDLINNDKVDIMVVSGTADTVNPVADQCEALGVPSVSNSTPWQSFYYQRGATAEKPFKWTYGHCLGLEQHTANFVSMWNQVTSNKKVGLMFSNSADGIAWTNEKTGMPPIVKAAGYTITMPAMYNPGTEDFTAAISQFKKEGCEIQYGVMTSPELSNFWKQCLQQGYKPKLMGAAKALVAAEELNAMGPTGYGLYTSCGWSPAYPFKDTLSGMTAQQLADEYEQMTGRQWGPILQEYARFEWVVDIFKRTKDLESKESILAALATTKMETTIGPIDFTSPVKLGTDHPVPNVYRVQMAAGQWRKGTGKWPFDMIITANAAAPLVPVQDKVQEIVYS
jgi:branched-chain amino acid transport system substrate-binding protein